MKRQRESKRPLLVALLLLALLLAACGGPADDNAARTGAAGSSVTTVEPTVADGPVQVGSPAPNFRLPTTVGSVVALDEMAGEAVVLNFWATWCGPCRLEMPELQAVYDEYHDNGLNVIAIEARGSGTAEESATFLDEVGVTFPNYRDEAGVMTSRYVKRPAWPISIFIDREGIVRYVQVGVMNRAFIEERLSELGF